jgi:hypothetical protein
VKSAKNLLCCFIKWSLKLFKFRLKLLNTSFVKFSSTIFHQNRFIHSQVTVHRVIKISMLQSCTCPKNNSICLWDTEFFSLALKYKTLTAENYVALYWGLLGKYLQDSKLWHLELVYYIAIFIVHWVQTVVTMYLFSLLCLPHVLINSGAVLFYIPV